VIDLNEMNYGDYELTVEYHSEYYSCLTGNSWLLDKVQHVKHNTAWYYVYVAMRYTQVITAGIAIPCKSHRY